MALLLAFVMGMILGMVVLVALVANRTRVMSDTIERQGRTIERLRERETLQHKLHGWKPEPSMNRLNLN